MVKDIELNLEQDEQKRLSYFNGLFFIDDSLLG